MQIRVPRCFLTSATFSMARALDTYAAGVVRGGICALTLTLFVGCHAARPLDTHQIRPLPYSTGPLQLRAVDGLRPALARSKDAPVYVLVAHGMIAHEPGYSEELQRNIAARLGLADHSPTEKTVLHRGYDVTVFSGPQPFGQSLPLKSSELRRTGWYGADGRTERLVFYEMLWAPLRDEIKNRFFACFESRSLEESAHCSRFSKAQPNQSSRAWINGWLKDDVLVNGFADAMVVLSPVGDVLRDDVSLAVCLIARDALQPVDKGWTKLPERQERCDLSSDYRRPEQIRSAALALSNAQFFALTHSLGSFLVLDAQHQAALTRPTEHYGSTREILAFHLLDHATVFMNANQIGLLQLGRLTAVCMPSDDAVPCPNETLRTIHSFVEADQPLQYFTTYVAFNDADDLLGFELPPYLADVGIVSRFVNVSVRNPAFRIPGLFKNPLAAHTSQASNPAIIEAIVEGFPLEGQ